MKKIPDLSVIILSFNTKTLLMRCVDSVRREQDRSGLSVELLVVDNGSVDGSVEWLKREARRKHQPLSAVFNRENVGYATANNQAAAASRGATILFLNSDTSVRPGAFRRMQEFFSAHSKIGIASCQLINPDGSIQPQGGALPRLSTVAIWAFFFDDLPILHQLLPSYQLRRLSHFRGKPKSIGWVSGAAMWVRRSVWTSLGGFDRTFFMYGEDVELCYRARRAGFGVMINPAARVLHVGRGSSGGGVRWAGGEISGLKRLFFLHKPRWELPLLTAILVLGMRARWLIFGILAGNPTARDTYAHATGMARQ